MSYDFVILDLDNTLFDFGASEIGAYQDAMTAAGLDTPEAWFADYARINGELWKGVEAGAVRPGDVRHLRFARLAAETEAVFDVEIAAEEFVRGLGWHGELLAGAAESLSALHARVPLAMVTNGLSDVQQTKIARLDLARFFEAIVISDEVGVAKPDPTIFDHALLHRPELDRERVLMVGDGLASDIAGGIAAGLDTCWFDRHGTGLPEGAPQPTHRVTDLAALPALLG